MTEPVKCKWCGETIFGLNNGLWVDRDDDPVCHQSEEGFHEPAEPSPAVPEFSKCKCSCHKDGGAYCGGTCCDAYENPAVPEAQTGPIPEDLRKAYEESAVEDNEWAWTRGYVRSLIERIARAEASVAELTKDKDFAGEILGKICVYGTLVEGEKPVDPPPHAAIDAILTQINRAEKAEASVAELDLVLRRVRDDMQAHRCGWKWLDDYIAARATGKES